MPNFPPALNLPQVAQQFKVLSEPAARKLRKLQPAKAPERTQGKIITGNLLSLIRGGAPVNIPVRPLQRSSAQVVVNPPKPVRKLPTAQATQNLVSNLARPNSLVGCLKQAVAQMSTTVKL